MTFGNVILIYLAVGAILSTLFTNVVEKTYDQWIRFIETTKTQKRTKGIYYRKEGCDEDCSMCSEDKIEQCKEKNLEIDEINEGLSDNESFIIEILNNKPRMFIIGCLFGVPIAVSIFLYRLANKYKQ